MVQYSAVLLVILTLVLTFTAANAQSNQSVYTSLDAKQCKKQKTSEADYMARCAGVAGYSLLVTEGDLRQNVTVVTPQGKKHSLELWHVVSSHFSTLGPKAEWRVRRTNGKMEPLALIVRFNASEDTENPKKITSYLAVAKITADKICVVEKVSPSSNANDSARLSADNAASKGCLEK